MWRYLGKYAILRGPKYAGEMRKFPIYVSHICVEVAVFYSVKGCRAKILPKLALILCKSMKTLSTLEKQQKNAIYIYMMKIAQNCHIFMQKLHMRH